MGIDDAKTCITEPSGRLALGIALRQTTFLLVFWLNAHFKWTRFKKISQYLILYLVTSTWSVSLNVEYFVSHCVVWPSVPASYDVDALSWYQQTLFSNCIFMYIFNYIYISDSRCDLKAVGRDACWVFFGWFQARRQNKTGGLLPYFQRDKYKNAHHAAAFPRHPDSSTVSHEERIEKKKRGETTLGRILNPCRLSGGTTRIFFRWKFLSFATDPSTSSSGLHRKRKQGTLFSYPSLSGAICLPAGGGWPQVCNGGAILLLNWKKT